MIKVSTTLLANVISFVTRAWLRMSSHRSFNPIKPVLGCLLVTVSTAWAQIGKAETLADAIALAYQSNPTLQSQRAQTRELDEAYVQQVAGWRPQLGVQLTGAYNDTQSANFLGGHSTTYQNSGQAEVAFNQPLITGGRVSTGVKAAGFDVLSSRAQLQATEQTVLQSVIQAYADCLRDQGVLQVREAELQVLQSQLDDARARRRGGEVTETDVLQSQTQLQSAQADLTTAEGQLQVSRAEYTTAVGQNPGQLAPLPPLPGLPISVDAAFDRAEANNPTLHQAQQSEQASRWRIANARAQNRPQVSLNGSYGYTGALEPFARSAFDHAFTAEAVLTQSIFTGGLNASNIRKAVDQNDSDRSQVEAVRRTVVQQVSQSWEQMLSLRQSAASYEAEKITARGYFGDTVKEYRVGQRNTLDVLTAEETLRAAEIAALQARHDAYLGEVSLLSATGLLTQDQLVPGARTYDPSRNFHTVVKAQAVPWEGVIAALDTASAPRPDRPEPLSAVPLALPSAPIATAGADVPLDASPATATPTKPLPSTTSPSTPATYGRDVGASAPILRGRI